MLPLPNVLPKATSRPSAEIEPAPWTPGIDAPLDVTLTRSVVPFHRSRTKTSSVPFESPGTRPFVVQLKTTNRPSAEMEPPYDGASPWRPPAPTLTRSVVPLWRSRTKTSTNPFVSPVTRFVAPRQKETYRPSSDKPDR